MPVDFGLSWAVLVPDEDDDPAHTWIGPSEAQDLAIGKPQCQRAHTEQRPVFYVFYSWAETSRLPGRLD